MLPEKIQTKLAAHLGIFKRLSRASVFIEHQEELQHPRIRSTFSLWSAQPVDFAIVPYQAPGSIVHMNKISF